MERLAKIGLVLATLEVSRWAFSKSVRMEIGRRDDWTCQEEECGLSFNDGYWVQASHYDHNKKNPSHNTTGNGRILCTLHHAIEHLEKGDEWSAKAILDQGVYTRQHVKETGQQTILTIDELRKLL